MKPKVHIIILVLLLLLWEVISCRFNCRLLLFDHITASVIRCSTQVGDRARQAARYRCAAADTSIVRSEYLNSNYILCDQRMASEHDYYYYYSTYSSSWSSVEWSDEHKPRRKVRVDWQHTFVIQSEPILGYWPWGCTLDANVKAYAIIQKSCRLGVKPCRFTVSVGTESVPTRLRRSQTVIINNLNSGLKVVLKRKKVSLQLQTIIGRSSPFIA